MHFALPERDPYFSRVHFLVEVNPPLCRLVDMSRRNGTFVNGQRVQTADLRYGDDPPGPVEVARDAIAELEGAVEALSTVSALPEKGQKR